MLTIRLQRHGKKGQPSYRLVVAPSRSKLIAPPTEDLGSYDPFTKATNFKKDRIEHWIKVGAQPSLTVHNLFVKNGIVDAPKKAVPMPRPVPKSAAVEPVAETSEAPVEAPVEAPAENG